MKKVTVNKTSINNTVTVLIVVVAYFILNAMIKNGSISNMLREQLPFLCAYIILAVSLNMVVGILGELSLGHAGFMCVGAFTGAMFSKCYAQSIINPYVRFGLALLVGGAAAAIFGAIIGISVLRLRGDYLAVVTLAFGEVIRTIMGELYVGCDSKGLHISMMNNKATESLTEGGVVLTKGPQGVTGLTGVYMDFQRDGTFFALGVILVIITLVIVLNFINSRTGRAVMAIRDNRIAAESVGINIVKYRIIIYIISSAFAGIAGVLYGHVLGSFSPPKFDYNLSIEILVFVVMGGIGSVRGSMIAAVIIRLLPEYLRSLQDKRMIIYAVVLIAMMIFNWNPKCKELRKRISAKLSPKRLFGRIFANKKARKEVSLESKKIDKGEM